MNEMAEKMDWEKEAPTLAKLQKENAFTVPSNYFDELHDAINQQIFLNELPKTSSNGFVVPEHYFVQSANQINALITIEESTNNTEFTVPENYFEHLQQNIISKTKTKQYKLWHQPLFKYAVAASLIIVSTTGWFANKTYQTKQLRKAELTTEQMLFYIDEDMMLEYLQEDQNVNNNFNHADMENYILDNFSTNDLSNNL